MSETLDPHNFIRQAGNAVDSVTVTNMRRHLEISPDVASFWNWCVGGSLRSLWGGQEQFSDGGFRICDIGCGDGDQTTHWVNLALDVDLPVRLTAIDIMPANIQGLVPKLTALNVPYETHVSDITKGFPFEDPQHMIGAFELIHWLTPDQIETFLQDTHDHLVPGGQLFLSYAGKYNNALLRTEKGTLDLSRGHARGTRPRTAYSFPTKKEMTFPDIDYLSAVGKKHGLQAYYHQPASNPYFPTIRHLPQATSAPTGARIGENAFCAFYRPL